MKLLTTVVLLEYCLIFLIGLILCILKIAIDYREKKIAQELPLLKARLKEMLVGSLDVCGLDSEEWEKRKWKRASLLQVLETFEVFIDNENWTKIKSFIAEKYLLPWARKGVKSHFWSKRNQSARIFLLLPKKSDLPFLQMFLKDKSFYIRMLAVAAMTKIPSDAIIEILLHKMSQEPTAARFPYRQAFLKMPLESLSHVIRVYQTSEDENLRLACLDIMSRRFLTNLLPVIKQDYQTSNPLIRIYMIRILGNLASDEAVSELLLALDDADPKVRAETLQSLARIRSEKSLKKVETLLHDVDYNVRLHAALALANFGKKGIQILELQDWDLDPKAYEVARFVLTMP